MTHLDDDENDCDKRGTCSRYKKHICGWCRYCKPIEITISKEDHFEYKQR